MTMEEKPGGQAGKPKYFFIDPNDQEEMKYIAKKLGCGVVDIMTAIEVLKTKRRAEIYTWIIDKAFKQQYR